MIVFESRLAPFDDLAWHIVIVRDEGVFFIGGEEGFSKADEEDEADWRGMPECGNVWWKGVK